MDWFKSSILILFGLSSIVCSHFPLRKYFHISSAKTWEDARLYCRENHTDLATFESIEEINQLNRPASFSGWAWFGLHDDASSWNGTLGNDSNSWRWSTTGQEIRSEYLNWDNGQPDYKQAKQSFVCMLSNSKWVDYAWTYMAGCYCYTDMGQNPKTYVFSSEPRTWYEAQAYCRQHYTDLALITSAEENAMASSVGNAKGWIGLYRTPWTWSDMSSSNFTNWYPGQPNNFYDHEYCASENEDHLWSDSLCTDLSHFICHEVRESKTTMKMKMRTTADLSDPVVQEQIVQKLGAVFTSQGWTNFKLQWTTPPHKTP